MKWFFGETHHHHFIKAWTTWCIKAFQTCSLNADEDWHVCEMTKCQGAASGFEHPEFFLLTLTSEKKKVYFHDLLLSARLFNIRISAVDFSCLLRSMSLVTRSGWAWHPDDLLNVTQWPDDDLLITVSHPWVRPPPSPEGPNGASRSQFHDLLDGFLLKSEQEHVIAGTEASRCSATSCRNGSGEQKLPGD